MCSIFQREFRFRRVTQQGRAVIVRISPAIDSEGRRVSATMRSKLLVASDSAEKFSSASKSYELCKRRKYLERRSRVNEI